MYRGPCIDAQNDSFRVHTLRKHVQHAKLAALTTPGSQSPTPDDQKSDPGQVEWELAPKGSAMSVGVSPGWAFGRLQRKTQHLLIGFRKWAQSVVQKSCFFTRLQEGLIKEQRGLQLKVLTLGLKVCLSLTGMNSWLGSCELPLSQRVAVLLRAHRARGPPTVRSDPTAEKAEPTSPAVMSRLQRCAPNSAI